MRILLLVDKYFSVNGGTPALSCARLMQDLGREFRRLGHDVVVATAAPDLEARREVAEESDLRVFRARSGRFKGVPLPLRAYNEWRLPAILWEEGKTFFAENPCELIVTYSPSIFLGRLVKRLKRLWSCRTYLVLRDIFPKWSVDAGVIRRGSLVHRLFRHYEAALYDTADVIGVESERTLEYFDRLAAGRRHNVEVLHNWMATEGVEVVETGLRRELGLEGRTVFLFGGNVGVAQEPSAVVHLADAMRDDPRAFFVVVGEGSELGRLVEAARDRGLGNIRFLPPVNYPTYLGMVAEADVGLLTLHRGLDSHNVPGRLLDYMYLGKPVLAAINPRNDLKGLLERENAGLVSDSGEWDAFHENSRRLVGDPALRRTLGDNGRRLLEASFSLPAASRQILSHVNAGSK